MRYLVIAALVLIVASLFSAMYYMMHDRSGSRRMMQALALRVGLSLTLFLFLLASYYFGWIEGRL